VVSATTGLDWAGRLDPRDRLVAMKDQVAVVVRPSKRAQSVADARRAARAELAIPASVTAGLDRRTVNVDPVALAAVWAYGWRWGPVPTLQRYAGYTPFLDDRNADRLLSADAPDTVLREAGGAIDGRLPAWESPSAFLALLCGYRQRVADGRWQRLDRVGGRCGEPREIGRFRIAEGQIVRVPTGGPGDVVVARFGMSRGIVDRVAALVFRPRTVPEVIADDRRARFVAATAGQDHVVRVPAKAGWAPEFEGAFQVGTIRFAYAGTVEVTFLRVPISP